MTQKIYTGCDFARTDADTTVLSACYKGKDGFFWIKDITFLRIKDADYGQKIRAFYLKWHPNFLRRWLFRLLRI